MQDYKYDITDLDDMVHALDSVITTINSDDDPWLYNNTWRAMELLKFLKTEKEELERRFSDAGL